MDNFKEKIKEYAGLVALIIFAISSVVGTSQVFGASGTRFPNGLSTDTTSPNAGEVRTGDLVVTDDVDVAGDIQINSAGTAITRINTGLCYVKAYATTIAASTTALVDCQGKTDVGSITGATTALAGVTVLDATMVDLATSTSNGVFGGLQLIGASASTTAGHIQLQLFNATGGTFTWPTTGTATGTASYIVTDQ